MKRSYLVSIFAILFLAFPLSSFVKSIRNHNFRFIDPGNMEIITFSPEKAVSYSSDSLFSSVEVIELNMPDDSKKNIIIEIARTDSFLVVNNGVRYCLFDLKGKFLRYIGTSGEGPNSNRSLAFFYADNNYILSICGNKWIKYSLKGFVTEKGKIPYEIYPNSIIPLNNTEWLMYNPRIYEKSDTLRLWTTDEKFSIKKRYLSFDRNFPTGGTGLMKYIFQTTNGIYISDRVVDTIYRFSLTKVEPYYIFDFGGLKYYRSIEMRNPEPNEVAGGLKIVSSNMVLLKVVFNQQRYLIYYNRTTKKTKTIKTILPGPDIINSWNLKGFDKYDRLYWCLNSSHDTLVNTSSLKYGYSEILKRRKGLFQGGNPIIAVTKLR
jgi:hypothetical protein